MSKWRVGVLTGGGDSSGINAFLRALYLGVQAEGGELIGIHNGWAGLVDLKTTEFTDELVDGITMKPGTMLGTSRTNIVKTNQIDTALENIEKAGITHLVVAGGDDTLGVAGHLAEKIDIPIVGIPQTIDNDIPGTDLTLGFATAVERGVEALHDVVPSNRGHDNPMLVEVMGRQAGWLALYIAVGGEADYVALPETEWSIDDLVSLHKNLDRPLLAVISEGVTSPELQLEHTKVDAFGNPALEGVVHQIADLFAQRSGKSPRVQVFGYHLRGGRPSVQDYNLAWNFAAGVVQAFKEGLTSKMIAWRQGEIQYVELSDIVGKRRVVPEEVIEQLTRFMWHLSS